VTCHKQHLLTIMFLLLSVVDTYKIVMCYMSQIHAFIKMGPACLLMYELYAFN